MRVGMKMGNAKPEISLLVNIPAMKEIIFASGDEAILVFVE